MIPAASVTGIDFLNPCPTLSSMIAAVYPAMNTSSDSIPCHVPVMLCIGRLPLLPSSVYTMVSAAAFMASTLSSSAFFSSAFFTASGSDWFTFLRWSSEVDASSVAASASVADAPGDFGVADRSSSSVGTAIGVTTDPGLPMPPPPAAMALVVWNIAPPAMSPKRMSATNAANVLFASIALARRWNAAGSFPSLRVRLESGPRHSRTCP